MTKLKKAYRTQSHRTFTPLMEGIGFKTERIACLEPFGLARAEAVELLSPETRAQWFDYLYQVSTASSILGASQHLLYCGRKV
jgi:hypothetical protein